MFAALVLVPGLAATGLTLLLGQLGVGVARANELPVQGSLLADEYPIVTRGRTWASITVAGRVVAALGALLVAGIAALAGGSHGWQWAFVVVAVPAVVVAVLAFRLPEPSARPVRAQGHLRRRRRRRRPRAHLAWRPPSRT